MQLIEKVVPVNFNLFLFGDEHLGSIMTYMKGIHKLQDMLESPWGGLTASHNFGWNSGDHIEAITVDDPRFDPKTAKNSIPDEQNDAWIEMWWPFRKKLIGMNDGNHPWKLYRVANLTKKACEKLGIHYGTWSARITFRDRKGNVIFRYFATHGRKRISSISPDPKRRKAYREFSLKRQLQDMAGDCLLMSKGHTHQILISRPEPELFLIDDGQTVKQAYTNPGQLSVHFPLIKEQQKQVIPTEGYIHPDYRWYVNTGSFLLSMREGISSYAEAAEYPPVELGFAIVEVRDRQIVDIKKVVL